MFLALRRIVYIGFGSGRDWHGKVLVFLQAIGLGIALSFQKSTATLCCMTVHIDVCFLDKVEHFTVYSSHY